jgi:hypothetical protein
MFLGLKGDSKDDTEIDENAGSSAAPKLRRVLSSPRTPLEELPIEPAADPPVEVEPLTPGCSDNDEDPLHMTSMAAATIPLNGFESQEVPKKRSLEAELLEKVDTSGKRFKTGDVEQKRSVELDDDGFAVNQDFDNE